jgi:hypothetical protein
MFPLVTLSISKAIAIAAHIEWWALTIPAVLGPLIRIPERWTRFEICCCRRWPLSPASEKPAV